MLITQLYHTWMKKIAQLLPDERITRMHNLAWFLAGIFESKSVHLSKVAGKIPGRATLVSITRRLGRFLENPEFRVRDWYEPIVKGLLAQRIGLEYRLIVDGSKVGFGHQLLVITLAYRRRAIPLVWMWVRSSRGHSTSGRQLALLNYIHKLLPGRCASAGVGRLGIWSGRSAETTGPMGLEVCFAPERQSFGARKRSIALGGFGKSSDPGRSKPLVGSKTTDPIGCLCGQCPGSLENRRKRTLVVGHQSALVSGGPASV